MNISEFQDVAAYPQIKDYVLEHSGLKVSNLYSSRVKRKCGLNVGKNYNLPKSSESITNKDLAMVIGDSLFGDSDGLNVEQRKYVDNESDRDEWNLHLAADTGVEKCRNQRKPQNVLFSLF